MRTKRKSLFETMTKAQQIKRDEYLKNETRKEEERRLIHQEWKKMYLDKNSNVFVKNHNSNLDRII